MGKRVVVAPTATEQNATPPTTRTIRKRKRNVATNGAIPKNVRLSGTGAAVSVTCKNNNLHHNYNWHENDDEDSSSNDAPPPPSMARNQFGKYANPSSIIINSSLNNERGMGSDAATIESPKPVYTLRPSLVNGVILYDLTQKPWRLGRPVGKGNFGEIFLASDNITVPVTSENAKFVVKIEPHSNGPLFVEIHCLMNTARKDSDHVNNDHKQKGKDEKVAQVSALPQLAPSGIPSYIASGSHYFGDARYRFLVLDRFDRDLHSLIKNCRVHQKSVLTLAVQIVNVLENLHSKGYCHNDVKAQNLMISKCMYYKRREPVTGNGKLSASGNNHRKRYDEHYEEKQPTTDSGNSSEQELNEDEDMEEENFILKRKSYAQDVEDDEDFDDGATTNSNNSNSMDIYETPVNRNRNRRLRKTIEFSGSNPVRSCRRQKRNSIYEEMVKSHYLRPTKRISYSEFFNEDGSVHGDGPNGNSSSADESEEFLPIRSRRTAKKLSQMSAHKASKRLTRRQEKLLASNSSGSQQHVIHQQQQHQHQHQQRDRERNIVATSVLEAVEEERIFLIDFGLASKFTDRGVHRPFVMDQRRAHDGTLEFTSRDAHMGAHSRRSDLECLGYNLIFWSQGYLPWKDAAMQHHQEKVHRAKEYLMTDVRELLKQIYGKQVPKYLGEFLHHVGQLAYNERPDYALYRRIFEREFQQLGYSLSEMRLDSHEITRTCIRIKEEIENKNDIFELGKPSIINNLTVGTPFQERTLSNRVSPKNLRSKSDKKALKKKKFSWAEVLSQDPDQIARERAEKEFDREEELSDVQQPTVRRYEGKPTYAILEIQQRMRLSGRLIQTNEIVNTEKVENTIEDDDIQEIESDEDDIEIEEIANNMETDDDTDEEDSTEDNETDEEDEDEQNDKDIDSDATEASDQLNNNHNGRVRRVRSQNAVTVTNRKSSSKGTNGRSIKINGSTNEKRTSTKKIKSRTRSNVTTTTTTTTTLLQINSKRGSATRCGRKAFKSNGMHTGTETGNFHLIEKQPHTSSSSHMEQEGQQRLVNGHTNGHTKAVYERRTRRCLIKTDTSTTTNTDLKASEGEESNSNFSPDVRSLFNVWKKINNETMYYRGSTTAARHYKK